LQAVCGALSFFRICRSPEIVKKSVKAWAGALASDERRLLDEVVAAFQASTGLPLALVKDPGGLGKGAGWRLALTLEPGAPERLYRPLLRRVDRAEKLGAIKAELQEGLEPGVVVTPKLSAALARQCRAMDVPYLDGQGNAYLNEPGMLILVMGQRQSQPGQGAAVQRATGRAGSATGLKLVFALLSDPGLLKATSPMLREAAGVSLGSVPAVLGDLEQRGLLLRIGWGKGWQVPRWQPLLEAWTTQYPLVLRPKLRRFRFRSPGQGQWWQEVNPADYGGQWGGEVAAALKGTVLKPQQSLLYLQPEAMRLGLARLIREHGLRPDPDGSGDVEVMEAFWSNERLGLSGATVPIPLVIADLLASLDSRNIEAAQELRGSWIHGVET
jgi:hypothetical protein